MYVKWVWDKPQLSEDKSELMSRPKGKLREYVMFISLL